LAKKPEADQTLTRETKARAQLEDAARVGRMRATLIVMSGERLGEMYHVGDLTTVGRGPECDTHLPQEGVSRRHCEISRRSDGLFWVRDLGSKNGTFVNGARIEEIELREGDKIQLGGLTLLRFALQDPLDESFQRRMYESAMRDGLTDAYNRKYLLDRLENEFAGAQRHKSPLAFLLFDLDHFKVVNDTHGHLAGDNVLRGVSHAVRGWLRQEDVFARYGGEEFCVLSRGIDEVGGVKLGERIRKGIETTQLFHDGHVIPVTVSIGVAAMSGSDSGTIQVAQDLIARADEALYAAKRAGRNRVVAASTMPAK
jgi:two-component system cell cycle response regulator